MFGILRYSFAIVASLCAVALGVERTFGQVLQGEAAYGSSHDDKRGLRRLLTLQDLPPIEKPTYGLAQVVPIPTGARSQVPDGFSVELVTSALRKPRVIREAPDGGLFVADTMVRFRYRNGQLKATGKPQRIIAGIPTTHQYARDIAFLADGRRLFFSVSSGSNAAQDMVPVPRLVNGNGTIWRVTYRGDTGTASSAGEPVQAGFDAAEGGDLYIAKCSACHLANGEGVPGAFPPLKGSGVVNKDDAAKHIQVVLNGMQGARAGGVVYASAMPPFAGVLSDAEIADIIDYERSSWGNHGIPVNAAQVAAERVRVK
jgi:mono/diheme cytochrome c family protein